MSKEICVDGCLEVPDDLDVDDFTNIFIEWVESQGWFFDGASKNIKKLMSNLL